MRSGETSAIVDCEKSIRQVRAVATLHQGAALRARWRDQAENSDEGQAHRRLRHESPLNMGGSTVWSLRDLSGPLIRARHRADRLRLHANSWIHRRLTVRQRKRLCARCLVALGWSACCENSIKQCRTSGSGCKQSVRAHIALTQAAPRALFQEVILQTWLHAKKRQRRRGGLRLLTRSRPRCLSVSPPRRTWRIRLRPVSGPGSSHPRAAVADGVDPQLPKLTPKRSLPLASPRQDSSALQVPARAGVKDTGGSFLEGQGSRTTSSSHAQLSPSVAQSNAESADTRDSGHSDPQMEPLMDLGGVQRSCSLPRMLPHAQGVVFPIEPSCRHEAETSDGVSQGGFVKECVAREPVAV